MIDATAALRTWYQSQLTLTTLTVKDDDKGIYRTPPGLPKVAGDKNSAPRCVVIQELPGPSEESYPNITPRFTIKCYAPTGPAAVDLYRHLWDCHYPGGVARGPTMINNRWLMRWATLTTPLADTEPEGWKVAVGTLTAAFDPLVGAT